MKSKVPPSPPRPAPGCRGNSVVCLEPNVCTQMTDAHPQEEIMEAFKVFDKVLAVAVVCASPSLLLRLSWTGRARASVCPVPQGDAHHSRYAADRRRDEGSAAGGRHERGRHDRLQRFRSQRYGLNATPQPPWEELFTASGCSSLCGGEWAVFRHRPRPLSRSVTHAHAYTPPAPPPGHSATDERRTTPVACHSMPSRLCLSATTNIVATTNK